MQVLVVIFERVNVLLTQGHQLLGLSAPVVAKLDEFLFFLFEDELQLFAAAMHGASVGLALDYLLLQVFDLQVLLGDDSL